MSDALEGRTGLMILVSIVVLVLVLASVALVFKSLKSRKDTISKIAPTEEVDDDEYQGSPQKTKSIRSSIRSSRKESDKPVVNTEKDQNTKNKKGALNLSPVSASPPKLTSNLSPNRASRSPSIFSNFVIKSPLKVDESKKKKKITGENSISVDNCISTDDDSANNLLGLDETNISGICAIDEPRLDHMELRKDINI